MPEYVTRDGAIPGLHAVADSEPLGWTSARVTRLVASAPWTLGRPQATRDQLWINLAAVPVRLAHPMDGDYWALPPHGTLLRPAAMSDRPLSGPPMEGVRIELSLRIDDEPTAGSVGPVVITDRAPGLIGAMLAAEVERCTPPGPLVEALRTSLVRWIQQRRPRPRPARGGLAPGQLRRAIDLLRAHAMTGLSLDALASALGLSPWHTARAFKQSTGQSPHQFLNGCRVERAKAMLQQQDPPIGVVAEAIGFSNPTTFARVFRRHTGMCPTRYRASQVGRSAVRRRTLGSAR